MRAQPAPQPPQKPADQPRTGPPRGSDQLGLRDALAFMVAAFLRLLPYVAVVVGVFVLLLVIARLLV
jgi:hypothetical protein